MKWLTPSGGRRWRWCCSIFREATGRPVSAALPVCRSGSRLAITDVGREVYEQAARGFAAIEDAERIAARRHEKPEGVLRQTFVDNLRFAADAFAPAERQVLMEPLNSRDTPGFLVDRTAPAISLLDEADRPNLALQYDIYHAQVMEGDLARTLEANLARIGHIQLADNPGRHQPGTGEINFPFLFRRLRALGYPGWIGCEYVPTGPTEDSFGWMAA